MGGLSRADRKLYTIHEVDEATITAACVAEEMLESGNMSDMLSITLKWLAMVAAVFLYCSTVMLVMLLYPAVDEQHLERMLILVLLVLLWFAFAVCIYAFGKHTNNKAKAYMEAIKLIRKADDLQGVAPNKRTRHLQLAEDLKSILCI